MITRLERSPNEAMGPLTKSRHFSDIIYLICCILGLGQARFFGFWVLIYYGKFNKSKWRLYKGCAKRHFKHVMYVST